MKIPPRRNNTHKNDYGSVLALAGSVFYPGAASLAVSAAMKSGAGLATLAFPSAAYCAVAPKLAPEIILMPLPDGKKGVLTPLAAAFLLEKIALARYDAVVAGPGLTVSPAAAGIIRRIAVLARPPAMVLDADALNSVAKYSPKTRFDSCRAVITPHPGEAARLMSVPPAEIQKNRRAYVRFLAEKFGCVCVLKGSRTLVSDGKRVYVNKTGNPGMATAGSGDVLAGVTAALVCRIPDAFKAASMAVYVHGLAGDIAARRVSQTSMTASDILSSLPAAFVGISSDKKR